jgi:hypothetical protein
MPLVLFVFRHFVEHEYDDECDSEVKGNRLHVKPCGWSPSTG